MMIQADNFPVVGIRDLYADRPEADILFNSLFGRKRIEHPHKHDFFVINLFKTGKGNHTIDFVDYEIGNHQIHMILPDQVHQWEILPGTEGYQLMISKNWFESLLPFLRFPSTFYQSHPVMEIDGNDFKTILYEFKAVEKLLKPKSVFIELVIKRCEIIALLISRLAEKIFGHQQQYFGHPLISKFNDLVEQYFTEQRQVSFYAEKLNITANYLNIICRKSLQASASSFIQQRILLEAKRLLKISDKSVKDIVYELGFYDPASFSKFFKQQTGMTPRQFRG